VIPHLSAPAPEPMLLELRAHSDWSSDSNSNALSNVLCSSNLHQQLLEKLVMVMAKQVLSATEF